MGQSCDECADRDRRIGELEDRVIWLETVLDETPAIIDCRLDRIENLAVRLQRIVSDVPA